MSSSCTRLAAALAVVAVLPACAGDGHAFATGTDGLACSPDGSTLFVPTGERSADTTWYVVDARTGRVRTKMHGGLGPHNTIVSPDGRLVAAVRHRRPVRLRTRERSR